MLLSGEARPDPGRTAALALALAASTGSWQDLPTVAVQGEHDVIGAADTQLALVLAAAVEDFVHAAVRRRASCDAEFSGMCGRVERQLSRLRAGTAGARELFEMPAPKKPAPTLPPPPLAKEGSKMEAVTWDGDNDLLEIKPAPRGGEVGGDPAEQRVEQWLGTIDRSTISPEHRQSLLAAARIATRE